MECKRKEEQSDIKLSIIALNLVKEKVPQKINKRQNQKKLIKDLVMKRLDDMNQLRQRNASYTGVQIKMEKRQINLHLQHKDSLV
jgi:hypothetical protein